MPNNKRGLSRIEVFCITGICIIAIFLLFCGMRYYQNSMARGNDSLKVHTAESTVRMNLSAYGCVITGCGENGTDCPHVKDQQTTGYYDPVKKKIFTEKPKGYNEYTDMLIGEKTYEGDRNTMIIMISGGNDQTHLSWVEGDNH